MAETTRQIDDSIGRMVTLNRDPTASLTVPSPMAHSVPSVIAASVPNPTFARFLSGQFANFGFKGTLASIELLVSLSFGSSLRNKLKTRANFRTATLETFGQAFRTK